MGKRWESRRGIKGRREEVGGVVVRDGETADRADRDYAFRRCRCLGAVDEW